MRTTSRRLASIIAAIAISALIAACGQAGGPASAPDRLALEQPGAVPADGAARDEAAVGGEDFAGGGDGSEDTAAPENASPIEQRIIKTGEISIQVADVTEGMRAVRSLADEMGGYVGASQAGDTREGGRATLALRVPAARFDATLDRLRELGDEVLNETTREEDVTGAIVDLEARITNLRASEETYRSLLARAERIDDILAVQAQLDNVRGQIEQLEAEVAYLGEQADLSTLTVSLVPAPLETTTQEWSPGQAVQEAVAALLSLGQGLLIALIWIAIVVVPILLGIGVIGFVLIRGMELLRRRAPSDRPTA